MNYSTIEELAEHILRLNEMRITVAIFMGAGVSVTAGIPTADQIVNDIEKKYVNAVRKAKERTYGEYMQCLKPGVRKEIIKNYMEDPKVNLAHLYMGSFVKNGYVDRILTTNFDSLAIKALGLNNIYPSIYDLAETRKFKINEIIDPSIFYIHGRYNGYYVLNTDEELRIHANAVRQLFEDTSRKRCWIVIGYSGANDPMFERFLEIEDYTYGLYWVGFNDQLPTDAAKKFLESKGDDVSYIKGYDADNFFIKLANELRINTPEIVSDPFGYLKDSIEGITTVFKEDKEMSLTQRAIKDINTAITLIRDKEDLDIVDIIQKTRDIWVFEDYTQIDDIYDKVVNSNSNEAKTNLAAAISNYCKSLETKDKELQKKYLNKRRKLIEHDDTYIEKGEAPIKEYFSIEKFDLFQSDENITLAGLEEAKKIFKSEDITIYGKRLYGSDLVKPYLYRIYVKSEHFSLIEKEFNNNNTINVVYEISQKLNVEIDSEKTHCFFADRVGRDSQLLHTYKEKVAIVHLQITYGITEGKRFPLELLVGKYLAPIGICGIVTDLYPHTKTEFSKIIDNVVKGKNRIKLLEKNSEYYYPFFSFIKRVERLYSIQSSPLLRVMIVTDEQCNYRCKFCCFLNETEKNMSYEIDMASIDIADFEFLIKCATKAGYERVMFTGGEPLLLPIESLLKLVEVIVNNNSIKDFWITTNASEMSEQVISELWNKGLKKFVISIPAETSEKYMKCNRSNIKLETILKNIEFTINKGFDIRVDVPLTKDGIAEFESLLILINKLKIIGVNKLSYFGLHKSRANFKIFNELFVDPDIITRELYYDDTWVLHRDGNVSYFMKDGFRIFLPSIITNRSRNCRQNRCNEYCQGNYAIYLMATTRGYLVRGCHREFSDGRNEFEINSRYLVNKQEDKIKELFLEARNYGCEREGNTFI